MGAAKHRDVTALELGYLQLTAVDLHCPRQQTEGGRKTWNEPGDTEIPLCFFPRVVTNTEPVPAQHVDKHGVWGISGKQQVNIRGYRRTMWKSGKSFSSLCP